MARAVIDLDRSATILDVADRIAQVPEEDDVVLVGAAGAPWLRSALFVDVARTLADGRRLSLVTSDPRARSLAASVHVPAFASVAALDRLELDPTERLDRRRAAAARPGRPAAALRAPVITRRLVGIAASLAAAALVLLAVVVPSAEVTVAPTTEAIGPIELDVRAGGNGEVARQELSDTITAKVPGTATGGRVEEAKAKGTVRLQNRQTRDIRIARGTEFRTANGIRFVSTEEKTLPRSIIVLFTVTVGQVDVAIEAAQAGTGGNVPAGAISVSPAPNDYNVTNTAATTGGETKLVPIVQQRDYDAAVALAPRELQRAGEDRLAKWRTDARPGTTVVPRVYTKVTSVTPVGDVVNKEIERFELTVTGIATAFSIPQGQPENTALDHLAALARPGYALDRRTARVEPPVLLDDPTGTGQIVWKVRASGVQLALIDHDRIRRALAGRSVDEAAPTLEGAGIRLESVRTEPSWWPRLPLLDARIVVQTVPARAAAP
ncbi:MAG TPA: baseplate J/gp47 family protein [Candidatus Limnocylindria bacterium]|nr:baseplate J/gp47 family protein [Candidatus Limnocylindria bacterium]